LEIIMATASFASTIAHIWNDVSLTNAQVLEQVNKLTDGAVSAWSDLKKKLRSKDAEKFIIREGGVKNTELPKARDSATAAPVAALVAPTPVAAPVEPAAVVALPDVAMPEVAAAPSAAEVVLENVRITVGSDAQETLRGTRQQILSWIITQADRKNWSKLQLKSGRSQIGFAGIQSDGVYTVTKQLEAGK
jgi:hypothetical protein